MQIFDIVSMGEANIKRHLRSQFAANAHIKDPRVIDMLLEKAYIDLEDTLLQHKQKNHLMLLFEGPVGTDQTMKMLKPDSSEEEQFARFL